jgi:hypothetical protein
MMTVDHEEPAGIEIFHKEQICAISAMAQGTAMNLGGFAPRGVMPLMRVFSFLVPKSEVAPVVTMERADIGFAMEMPAGYDPAAARRHDEPAWPSDADSGMIVPLVRLAWGRSGDKGNLFNVGVFARQPRFYPYMAAALSAEVVAQWFAHMADDPDHARADRYLLPGSHGLNFVVHDALGGGASVCARVDTLAKAMAQILLDYPVPVSPAIYAELESAIAREAAA